jgi:hypothetical protein
MKFRNRLDSPLKFEIDGVRYNVDVGGTCDIPDKFAYHVEHAGLPLDMEDPPPLMMRGSRGDGTEPGKKGGSHQTDENQKPVAHGLTGHYGTDEERQLNEERRRAAGAQQADEKHAADDDKRHADDKHDDKHAAAKHTKR